MKKIFAHLTPAIADTAIDCAIKSIFVNQDLLKRFVQANVSFHVVFLIKEENNQAEAKIILEKSVGFVDDNSLLIARELFNKSWDKNYSTKKEGILRNCDFHRSSNLVVICAGPDRWLCESLAKVISTTSIGMATFSATKEQP